LVQTRGVAVRNRKISPKNIIKFAKTKINCFRQNDVFCMDRISL